MARNRIMKAIMPMMPKPRSVMRRVVEYSFQVGFLAILNRVIDDFMKLTSPIYVIFSSAGYIVYLLPPPSRR